MCCVFCVSTRPGQWAIRNNPLHSKNPLRALHLLLPLKVGNWVDAHLQRFRPVLVQSLGPLADHGFLFVDRRGTGPRRSIYRLVTSTVAQLLPGVSTNPHLFRSIIVSQALHHRPPGLALSDGVEALATSLCNTSRTIRAHYLVLHDASQHALSQSLIDRALSFSSSSSSSPPSTPPPSS